MVREAFLLGVAWKKWHFFNCKYLMNNRNTLLRCASFWNNIQNSIPVHSRFTWNKREPPRTIQNWHFVRRMARRESGVIPRIRAAQGTSDGCNFGERERVTEQVRRDYTKCKFCIIKGSEMREKGISLRMPVSASVAREGFKTSILPFLRLR